MPYLIALLLIAIGGIGYFFTADKPPLAQNEQTIEEIKEELATNLEPDPATSTQAVATPDDVVETTSAALPPKDSSVPIPAPSTPKPTPTPAPTQTTNDYKNGTFTGDVTYRVPESTYTMHVSLTVKNDTVTGANVVFDGRAANDSRSVRFADSYKSYVIGKSLDSISLSRVGGASLTTSAFNKAVSQIRSEAQA